MISLPGTSSIDMYDWIWIGWHFCQEAPQVLTYMALLRVLQGPIVNSAKFPKNAGFMFLSDESDYGIPISP